MINVTPERKKELLKQFNANPEMREAVREELLAGIYSNGVIKEGERHNPMINAVLSVVWAADEQESMEKIGAKVVALAEGLRCVESAFKRIEENYKEDKPSKEGGNKAR